MADLPETVTECGGCEEPLNVLSPYLAVQIKAERQVLVMMAQPTSEDEENPTDEAPLVNLGTRSGRGRLVKFHSFQCLWRYAKDRKELKARIEYHHEDGDPYAPEDNRTPEELVEAGELPSEVLAAQAALAEFTPGAVEGSEG